MSRLQSMARFELPTIQRPSDVLMRNMWEEEREEARRELVDRYLEQYYEAVGVMPSREMIQETFDYIELDNRLVDEVIAQFKKSYGLEGMTIVNR